MRARAKAEREHVTINEHRRKDNGKMQYILTWSPKKKDRRRMAFSCSVKANEEADRIETLMQQGYAAVATISRARLMALNYFLEQLPDDDGSTLHKIFYSYFEKKDNATALDRTTVKQTGELFIKSRSSPEEFSVRQIRDVRQHINRLITEFGDRPLSSVTHTELKIYLTEEVGGAPKTRKNHWVTLCCFFRWARDIGTDDKKFLPEGQRTAPELVTPPKVKKTEHGVYSPEDFTRLLVFTPPDLVIFMVLGQFAGIRAEERNRMVWDHWRVNEDNKLVLNENVTKTERRRRVDVEPNLGEWLAIFKGEPDELMVPQRKPYDYTGSIAAAAGLEWIDNAFRAGYASYHQELYDNPILTAKNDGHSVTELETTYKSIKGVTKAKARQLFDITPGTVLAFAKLHNLPRPAWADLVLLKVA